MIDLAGLLSEELPAAVALRHRLHADPRLSGDEDDTAEAVCAAITAEAQRVACTGRMLRLGSRTGPCIVLRAELDALPLQECSARAWSSHRPGAMHACGHDVHCAALAAVAQTVRHLDLPIGMLVLLQPREEKAPSGALDVLAVQRFLDHQPAAIIVVRGGHRAYPHHTDDPVLAIANVVTALHHLVSRRVDPLHAVVLTIGEIHAGTAPNIIPGTAQATATLRVLDPTDRAPLHAAIRATVTGIATAYGCEATLDITELIPLLNNHIRLAEQAARAVTRSGLAPVEFRSCGADDFAFYTSRMPSLMMFVGTGNGATGAPGLHHPSFVPPDNVIKDVSTAYLAGLRGAIDTLGLDCPGPGGP